jgi:hypothetical protein
VSAAQVKTYANWAMIHLALDCAGAIKALGMGSFELLVLIVLSRHLNQETGIWALSYATIGRECACHRDTAMKAVHKLVDAGLVEIVGHHDSGAYMFRLGPVAINPHPLASATPPAGIGYPHPLASATPAVDSGYPSGCEPHVVDINKEEEEKKIDSPDSDRRTDGRDSSDSSPLSETKDKNQGEGKSARASGGLRSGSGVNDTNTEYVAVHVAPYTSVSRENKSRESRAAAVEHVDPTLPEAKLAARYHELLGHRPALAEASVTRWPATFRELLLSYSYGDLSASIEWAFKASPFWRDKMDRRKEDPADYFAAKADLIVPDGRNYVTPTAAPQSTTKHWLDGLLNETI